MLLCCLSSSSSVVTSSNSSLHESSHGSTNNISLRTFSSFQNFGLECCWGLKSWNSSVIWSLVSLSGEQFFKRLSFSEDYHYHFLVFPGNQLFSNLCNIYFVFFYYFCFLINYFWLFYNKVASFGCFAATDFTSTLFIFC